MKLSFILISPPLTLPPSLPPSLPPFFRFRTFCPQAGISIEELRERIRGLAYLLQDLPHGEMAELDNKVREHPSLPPFLPPSLPSFLPRTEGTSLSPVIPHQRPPPLPPSLPPSSQLCEIYRALALGTAEFETEAPLELVKVREGGREGGRERGKFGLPDNLSVL